VNWHHFGLRNQPVFGWMFGAIESGVVLAHEGGMFSCPFRVWGWTGSGVAAERYKEAFFRG
jgi:hypothetical protein